MLSAFLEEQAARGNLDPLALLLVMAKLMQSGIPLVSNLIGMPNDALLSAIVSIIGGGDSFPVYQHTKSQQPPRAP